MILRRALIAIVLVCAWLCATPLAHAQPLPALTAPVNDFARVVDAPSAAALDARIRALRDASGDTIVVATVDSIAPYGSIEEYAVRLFEQAGIGDRESDRGLLVLLAVSERRVRIEVGYGLEDAVPDGFAGDVIRRQLLPAFRNGDYGPGLLAGVTTLAQRIADVRGVTLAGVPPAPAAPERHGPSAWQIILVIIVIVAIANLGAGGGSGSLRRRRGGRWHGGVGGFGGGFGGFGGGGFGGGGGGFGGFGGGGSGGGGASGGW